MMKTNLMMVMAVLCSLYLHRCSASDEEEQEDPSSSVGFGAGPTACMEEKRAEDPKLDTYFTSCIFNCGFAGSDCVKRIPEFEECFDGEVPSPTLSGLIGFPDEQSACIEEVKSYSDEAVNEIFACAEFCSDSAIHCIENIKQLRKCFQQ